MLAFPDFVYYKNTWIPARFLKAQTAVHIAKFVQPVLQEDYLTGT